MTNKGDKEMFVSGVDFFKVTQPSEIRTLGITRSQGGIPNEIIYDNVE